MKSYLLGTLVVLAFGTALGQKTVTGYIINHNNDTVKVSILIPPALSSKSGEQDLAQGVEIKEGDTFKMVLPSDINEYGFRHKGKDYTRISKPINEYRRLFLFPEYVGAKASFYSVTMKKEHNDQSSGYYAGTLVPSPKSLTRTLYTFEKKDGAILFVRRDEMPKELKEKLKYFFSDSPEVQEKIEKKVSSRLSPTLMWNAIKDIVIMYNQE